MPRRFIARHPYRTYGLISMICFFYGFKKSVDGQLDMGSTDYRKISNVALSNGCTMGIWWPVMCCDAVMSKAKDYGSYLSNRVTGEVLPSIVESYHKRRVSSSSMFADKPGY